MPPHLPLLLPENLAWMALLENSPNTKEEAGITLTLKPEEKNYRPGPSGTEVQNTLQTSTGERFTVITIIQDEKGLREEQVKCWIHRMRNYL